ncbi:hypothetical protein RYX36_020504, partial [Vicia faba]
VFFPEPKARSYGNLTEETIFDHMKRKSKDFPQISKLDCVPTPIPKTEFFSKKNRNSLKVALGVVPKTKFSDMTTGNTLMSDIEPADIRNYPSGIQVVCFPMSKKKNRSSDFGNFERSSKKQHCLIQIFMFHLVSVKVHIPATSPLR